MRQSNNIHYLTQDEMKRLLSVIKSKRTGIRDKAIFFLAYRHGLRASEVGLLRRTDVDFKKGRVYIQRAKGSYSGEYPLEADEIKILKSYLRTRKDESTYLFPSERGTPISRITLHHLMNKYGELADIPKEKRHFHVLKHSIATHLIDAGADTLFVKDWLGHKNIQNTTIYSRLTNPAREEQARKIFASPRVV